MNKIVTTENKKGKLMAALTNAKMQLGTAAIAIATGSTSVFANNTGNSFTPYSNGNISGTSIMKSLATVVSTLGTYVGGAYLILSILTLILAVRNEDNEGRNKAILNMVAAMALFSLGAIIKIFMGDFNS